MYSRYRSNRSYAGKRYGTRYSRYSSSAAKAASVVKASQRGTKRVSVVIPRTFDGQFTFQANQNYSDVLSVKATTLTDAATLPYSQCYRAYAALYDECRIVGCKTSWAFGNSLITGSSTYMTLYSAMDRAFNQQTSSADPNAMTQTEIAASSSCMKTNFTVQQRLAATRNFYARTFLEKNTWWDSYVDSNASNQYQLPALKANPNAYNPIMYVFLSCGASPTSLTTLPFRVEITWILEFRNPKCSFTSAAAKSLISDEPADTKGLFGTKIDDDEEEDDKKSAMTEVEGGSS